MEEFRLARVRVSIYTDGRRTREILDVLTPEETDAKMMKVAAEIIRWHARERMAALMDEFGPVVVEPE